MNAKMLMLGTLLLAGLSFAISEIPAECRWSHAMTDRYLCNVLNAFDGDYGGWSSDYGYYTLADMLADDNETYDTYLENMHAYLGAIRLVPSTMRHGTFMMRQNYCTEEEPYYVPPEFRSGMMEYNTYSALFKREFNSFLRAYLANNPTDRGEVLGYLSGIRADYRDCISPAK